MRESTLVPTNLLNWPRVATLLPDLKLILLALWSSTYLGMRGCGLVPVNPFASTLGLDPAALQSGLDILEKAGLIASDHKTGEIFVCDWYRFHKFNSPKIYASLVSSVAKIESFELRTIVTSLLPPAPAYPSKGNGSAPSAAAISPKGNGNPPAPTAASVAAPSRTADVQCEQTGAVIRDESDRVQIGALTDTHGIDKIRQIVSEIRTNGGYPFISEINKTIRKNEPSKAEAAKIRARGLDGALMPTPRSQRIGYDGVVYDTPVIKNPVRVTI